MKSEGHSSGISNGADPQNDETTITKKEPRTLGAWAIFAGETHMDDRVFVRLAPSKLCSTLPVVQRCRVTSFRKTCAHKTNENMKSQGHAWNDIEFALS